MATKWGYRWKLENGISLKNYNYCERRKIIEVK